MKAFEFLIDADYYPPSLIFNYKETFDLLRGINSELINEILNLRNEIIEKSKGYTIPPLSAFGVDGRKEIRQYFLDLKMDIEKNFYRN